MAWVALTLQLEEAAAESFSDALIEAGAVSVELENPAHGTQTMTALVDEAADAHAVLASAARLAGIAVPSAVLGTVAERDWVRESQSQFAPYAIGARLWVGPTWLEPPPEAAATVRLDPGLAFGTGSHPTTRLVLRYLVRSLTPGASVLDYGCGSGILAIAAATLGATRVDACDVDPVAVQTASDNARANGVALRALLPDALRPATYDFVVANILAQPLIGLAPVLAAHSARGGGLALSGILAAQAAEVAAAYANHYDMQIVETEEGWVLLEGRRR